tara:strand:+ start:1021 stop:1836 length:816 start_codon:yes stop_codon:yes gene_type:complete
MEINKIHLGDCLEVMKTLPNESIDCIVTSPPYWLQRDYGWDGQWGMEETFYEYLDKLFSMMDEAKRILKNDGTIFVNIGDGYARTGGKSLGKKQPNALLYATQEGIRGGNNKGVAGIQDKTLLQIPYRFSIGCIDRGWILRNNIIWFKRNAMPESVKDRFTKSHEVIFMFAKNKEYFFDEKFVAQDVWDIPLTPNGTKHIASYNTDLIGRPIVCGCRKGGIVLDMFCGAGTTGIRALELGRNFIGIDGKKEYVDMAQKRIDEMLSAPQLTF